MYRTAIASIIASPTGTTMARLKITPQRGHAVAFAEIMARQAGLSDDVRWCAAVIVRGPGLAHAFENARFLYS
jgi:hypothetical protein